MAATIALTNQMSGGGPVEHPRRTVDPPPDPTSSPAGLAPPAAGEDLTSGEDVAARLPRAGASPDPTSPPPAGPGKAAGGGDHVPHDAEPVKAGDAIQSADEGVGPDGIGGQLPREAVANADGPAPNPSPVMAWCDQHGQQIRLTRVMLRKLHPDEFGDLRDWRDLDELRGERATKAITYLDAWLHSIEEG